VPLADQLPEEDPEASFQTREELEEHETK